MRCRYIIMIDRVQCLERGTVYRIRNRKTGKCLSLCSKLQLKMMKVMQSAEQLWVLNEVKNEEYEIIQVRYGLVLTLQNKNAGPSIRMVKEKITKDQFWFIIYAETAHSNTYFWIKPIENQAVSLCCSSLSDQVKLSGIDQSLNICLWEFEPLPPASEVLSGLSMFRSVTSNLVLDVSDIASKQGVSIIQYLFTGAGNQRWIIEPYADEKQGSNEFTIRNYSSGLNLAGVFNKEPNKIIQALFNGSPEQRWRFLPVKENTYLIQSAYDNSFYLGTTSDKGGSLVSLVQDRLRCHWIIEGFLP